MMNTFTLIFLLALAAGLVLQSWLSRRHLRHIQRNRERVPEDFARDISLEAHRKAADYSVARIRLGEVELLFGSLLLLWWTLGGGVNWLQGIWSGLLSDERISGTGLILSLFLISTLLDLPLSAWRTFVVEARFGFNRTTPARFLGDQLLQAVLMIVIGGPLIWTVLWLMQQAGQFWWLAAWVVWTLFTLTLTWAYPVLIAPLFNKFTPLDEGELKQRIGGLLTRCGFTSNGIFVMDGSRRSGHGNAYFTGLGDNKRVVFFDTLVKSLDPEELEAVLAHELGHYRRHHILKQLVATTVISLVGFALLGWLIHQPWFYTGLGVDHPSHPAALLLFLLTAPVFAQFLEPLGSLLMRRYEFQADEYAVAHTDPKALTGALVKLYKDNASTLTPDPLYSAFHDSHPPAAVRIAHISARMVHQQDGA